jgi:signal transduction histidine kinase/CheY-like chemotaxis protein
VQLTFLNKFEPTLGPDEGAYRLHFFHSDKSQALRNALISVGLILLVFVAEVSFFDHQQIGPIVAVRVAFIVFSIALFVFKRGMHTPAELDRTALIWTTAAAAQFVAMTALRPPSKVDDASVVMVVLALYALTPVPLFTRTLPAVLLTVGNFLVLWLVRDAPLLSLWPTSLVLVAMNALGLMGSAHFHSQRRRQFQSQEKLRASLQERDALIDRLRQSNKMESMGRIVGGVAHDFNNILGTMLASVEFLIAELPSGTTPRADAETLRGSVKRGADLTKQLLAFSRQQVLEPKVVSLNELVVDTQRMLMRTIGENVAIAVSLGDHLSAVKVDPGQVQQILLNLAVNSRDAMPNGGTLTIKTRNVTLTESTLMSHSVGAPGQYAVITVSDGGTGMDSATLAQIFEPFFTTKPKGRGTGLGLSTVFGIVEQSGGYIRVESTLGEGTTFEIFLPAVSERPQMLAEPKEQPVPRGSETILLAEDDPDLRTLMARVLSAQGYRVLQATDGVDALRVAEQHHGSLDLLTTDMVMPAMGGYDLAHELSARRPGVKVLFMSGYTDDAFGRGKLQPSDAFLQKPVDPKLLARKVRQVLDGSLVA